MAHDIAKQDRRRLEEKQQKYNNMDNKEMLVFHTEDDSSYNLASSGKSNIKQGVLDANQVLYEPSFGNVKRAVIPIDSNGELKMHNRAASVDILSPPAVSKKESIAFDVFLNDDKDTVHSSPNKRFPKRLNRNGNVNTSVEESSEKVTPSPSAQITPTFQKKSWGNPLTSVEEIRKRPTAANADTPYVPSNIKPSRYIDSSPNRQKIVSNESSWSVDEDFQGKQNNFKIAERRQLEARERAKDALKKLREHNSIASVKPPLPSTRQSVTNVSEVGEVPSACVRDNSPARKLRLTAMINNVAKVQQSTEALVQNVKNRSASRLSENECKHDLDDDLRYTFEPVEENWFDSPADTDECHVHEDVSNLQCALANELMGYDTAGGTSCV